MRKGDGKWKKRCFRNNCSYLIGRMNIRSASDLPLKRREIQTSHVLLNLDDMHNSFLIQTYISDFAKSRNRKRGSNNG